MTAAADSIRGMVVAEMRRQGVTHWPLGLTGVCLDCQHVSLLGDTCPACASGSVVNLAWWLERTR